MNLSLSKRLNEIVEQYIPASPGLSESVIEWFNDWQRDTSAVDHADLKAEIQDLKLDIKDLRIELKDEIHTLELNTSERFNVLEKNIAEVRSELKGDIASLELNTAERFNALEKNIAEVRSELKGDIATLERNILLVRSESREQFLALEKTIKVNFKWAMLLATGLLLPIALPHIQSWFQR